MRIPVPAAACAALFVAFGPVAAGEARAPCTSSLVFVSEPGDSIGQGQTRSFKAVTTARISENEVAVRVNENREGPQYSLVLRAPVGQGLRKGVYIVDGSDAENVPQLAFGGENRFCRQVEGRFEIEKIRFGAFGYVEQLRANFEQRCDGSTSTLWGDVIVDNPDKPPMMRVKLRIEPKARIVQNELRPTIVYACEYATGGSILAELTQVQPDGNVAREVFEERGFGCGPRARRQYLPFSASMFRRGTASLRVTIHMHDPNYSEYEGDATVDRTARSTIRIR